MLSKVADRFTFLRDQASRFPDSFRDRHIPHNSLQVISMNKVFKSVWSEALGAWVAASELCRGRGKGGGKVARSAVAAALVLAAGSAMASTNTGNGATSTGPNDNALGDGSYANGTAGADSTAIGHNVKTNGGNAFSIGSIITNGAASSSLSPREPGKTLVAVGVANYKGYGAVGSGATYRSRDGAWLINGALSVTPHGDTGARAQVGYEF